MMKNITILLIGFILASCASQKNISEEPNGNISLIYNNWKLISIGGEAIKEESLENLQQIPEIEFNEVENRIFGNDGCNSISGSIERIGKSELKLGPLLGTKMACMDMSIPDKFGQALAKANSFLLLDMIQPGSHNNDPIHYLHLLDKDDLVLMRFVMIE